MYMELAYDREDSSHYIIDNLFFLRRACHLHLNYASLVVSFRLLNTCCQVADNLSNLIVVFQAPSQAPHLVTVYNSSSTSLDVQWSLLLEKHFQGQPTGYRISYYSDKSENDTKVMSLNYATNTTTLTNLKAYTMYVIYVSAVSSGGIGPAKTARARTDAGGKEMLKWM